MSYLLIQARPGRERSVGQELLKKRNIDDVHLIYGVYDLIARVNTRDADELQDFILNDVRHMDSIQRTETLLVAD